MRAARANLVESEVTVAGNGEKWRWANPQGTQRVVHFDELRAALASGALPPYTLVWRRGMPDWQPAHLVGELATAAISAQQGVIPNVPPPPLHIVAVQAEFERRGDQKRKDTPSDEPPAPPVHQYAALAAGAPPRAAAALPVSQRPATPAAPPVSALPAPSADDDEDGVLKTLVARPAMVPAAAQRSAPATHQPILAAQRVASRASPLAAASGVRPRLGTASRRAAGARLGATVEQRSLTRERARIAGTAAAQKSPGSEQSGPACPAPHHPGSWGAAVGTSGQRARPRGASHRRACAALDTSLGTDQVASLQRRARS